MIAIETAVAVALAVLLTALTWESVGFLFLMLTPWVGLLIVLFKQRRMNRHLQRRRPVRPTSR